MNTDHHDAPGPNYSERIDLGALSSMTSPRLVVGIGLADGDGREAEIMSAAGFCTVRVFRDPGALSASLDDGSLDAAVRGSLPAEPFLAAVRSMRPGVTVRRIALLRLADGKPFLLAPVGIDEGGTLRGMRLLVEDCRDFCSLLGWEPRIAVLSAGRAEDAGRGEAIARSIRRGDLLAELPDVHHFHITIEEAMGWADCIVAPDGVTGNLIYRTLTRLGGAASLGALYFPLELRLADTSRSGTVEEYVGAIALANIAAAKRKATCG